MFFWRSFYSFVSFLALFTKQNTAQRAVFLFGKDSRADSKGAVLENEPAARFPRDPARPQAGEAADYYCKTTFAFHARRDFFYCFR